MRLFHFQLAFVSSQFFVQPRDQRTDARLSESPFRAGVLLLQLTQPLFQVAQFFAGSLVFDGIANHSMISTTPFRRRSSSRVRIKNLVHRRHSLSSWAGKRSFASRSVQSAYSSAAASSPRAILSSKSGGRNTTASTSPGRDLSVTKLPSTR